MLDTTAVPTAGIMESGRDGTKYLGRGAGTLFVIEDDEVGGVRIWVRQWAAPNFPLIGMSANRQSQPTPSSLVFPFMSSDRAALANVHELFPTVDEAYRLLDVYGAWGHERVALTT